MNRLILYVGGFQLPESNAAAQRVVGIAKGLRDIGYNVIFLNSLKNTGNSGVVEKEYFGFKCYEYGRERNVDYLISAKTTLGFVEKLHPDAIIAYNYPAIALNQIRKYCKANRIKCYADVTEWYNAAGKNVIVRLIKGFDTTYRMKVVQNKLDGIIAISRYLYDYYKDYTNTVLIPPTVDITDGKWHTGSKKHREYVSFAYAGVPYASKERLDLIVSAVGEVAKKVAVRLNIVGITKEQFEALYAWKGPLPESVVFWGRVEHQKALEIVEESDWSIILRDNSRLVRAGFPTKLVESISCGTPVIANRFSNVFDYLTEKNSICVEDMDDIAGYMIQASKKGYTVNQSVFDYHRYLREVNELLKNAD